MINEDLRHRRRLDLEVTGVVYRRAGHQDIHKKSEDENMGQRGKWMKRMCMLLIHTIQSYNQTHIKMNSTAWKLFYNHDES
jgi:hypothetical protein